MTTVKNLGRSRDGIGQSVAMRVAEIGPEDNYRDGHGRPIAGFQFQTVERGGRVGCRGRVVKTVGEAETEAALYRVI